MRDIATRIAWSFLGRPYVWGGNDPSGFDCSGYVIEILKSVGVLPRNGDWTAAGLKNFGWKSYLSDATTQPGWLVFWENAGKITHVEYVLTERLSIGASGGGSGTRSAADAWAHDAYVKIRPFRTRAGISGFVDPFYGE